MRFAWFGVLMLSSVFHNIAKVWSVVDGVMVDGSAATILVHFSKEEKASLGDIQ
jgi:hypothetical protein